MSDQRTREAPLPSPSDLKEIIDAERTGEPFLHWRDGDGAQHVLFLDGHGGERLTVGRRPDSDIALAWDLEVSRAHALLERIGGQWTVLDDGLSRNGTYLNGSRVLGRHTLHDKDRLVFGQTPMVFRRPPEPDEGASTARAAGNATDVPLSETQRKVLLALCRPVNASAFATPATNKQIADEVYLSVDAVKAHLRVLFDRFGIGEKPQNEKRASLVARVLQEGVLKPRDF
jgi:hypothetical protein